MNILYCFVFKGRFEIAFMGFMPLYQTLSPCFFTTKVSVQRQLATIMIIAISAVYGIVSHSYGNF